MLIRNAEILGQGFRDIRVGKDTIAAIGRLAPLPGEDVLDASGGALLPGLHDHHIHLAGLAARKNSVWCGPPEVTSSGELAHRLGSPGSGWLRAIGYHESVLGGLPTARELDQLVADRPLRLQHRSGRMWLLNSRALDELLTRAAPPPGLERDAGSYTGRLFDEDDWLRRALGNAPPDFSAISADLARHGITGITDMSPHNGLEMADHFARQMESGALMQHCLLAGDLSLSEAAPSAWQLGPAKMHLHEFALPPFEDAVRFIAAAHESARPVAIHCVSEVELVFAIAALERAGSRSGDRIEHASVAPPGLVERMAALDLGVCSQPHFVFERGDRYLADVERRHHADLYRLRSLTRAGIPLAGGSDAPFGSPDPWMAMASAVSRKTADARSINTAEALDAECALSLYLAAPENLSRQRDIAIGGTADLVLLDRNWDEARNRLSSDDVAMTMISGRIVHNRIDQAPFQRAPGR